MPEAVQNILSSRLFATRGGTIAVGLFAALLALLILLLYLSNYRSSIRSSSAPVPVLVAKRLIPQGTSGDVLGSSGGFEATEVSKGEVKEGAVADPAILRGRVTIADVYPGQQLTVADFTPTAVATLGSRLTGKQRAMSIPIDSVHGMIGQVVPGDRVDIYAEVGGASSGVTEPAVRAIIQNVLVLGTSGAAGGLGGSDASSLTVRVSPNQASRVAWAADNSKLWVVLRPATRGGSIGPNTVTARQLLLGKTVPEGN